MTTTSRAPFEKQGAGSEPNGRMPLAILLQLGTDVPEFWEEAVLRDALEPTDSGGPSGSRFESKNPLHRNKMSPAVLREEVGDFGQILAEAIKLVLRNGVAVNLQPCFLDGRVGLVREGPVPLQQFLSDGIAFSVQHPDDLVVKAGFLERFFDGGINMRDVAVCLFHRLGLVTQDELNVSVHEGKLP